MHQRLAAADEVHDYVKLRFENGDILSIYNACTVLAVNEAVELAALAGRCVDAVTEQEDAIRLIFGSLVLSVDLRDAAFKGPEAMQYLRPGRLPMVWS